MRILVVGATGLVGFAICEQLHKRGMGQIVGASRRGSSRVNLGEDDASQRLQSLDAMNIPLQTLQATHFQDFDLVFFTAGSAVSSQYVPLALEAGATVIDNTSYFRMQDNVPLVVPGINDDAIKAGELIANPNCSTIQLAYVIAQLQTELGVEHVDVVSMQSISGAGASSLSQLQEDTQHALAHGQMQGMAFDCDTKIDAWVADGLCREEWKIENEMAKILGPISVHASCVRIPVLYGHTQAVTITFDREISLEQCATILKRSKVLCYYEQQQDLSPMRHAFGNARVHVGRLRLNRDKKSIRLMVLADNVLRGGATNATEIAAVVIKKVEEENGIRER